MSAYNPDNHSMWLELTCFYSMGSPKGSRQHGCLKQLLNGVYTFNSNSLSLYRYTTNPLFGEDYQDRFDPQSYMQMYYADDSDPVQRFVMKQLHRFYQSKSTETKFKILDVGTGPIIANIISAAPYASEIILSEYAKPNRDALLQWLKNNPKAHDWKPLFKYVVIDLEGKSKEEVPIREELVRKVIKAVVPCDVHSTPPIPTDYVDDYDIVTGFLCLPSACSTEGEYMAALARLCDLVKPGGSIVLYEGEGKETPTPTSYRVGSQNFSDLLFPKEYISILLKQAGFNDVKIATLPRRKFPTLIDELPDYVGFNFITACKTN